MNEASFGTSHVRCWRKFALWSSPPGHAPNCGIPMKSDVIFKHIWLIVSYEKSYFMLLCYL